MTRAHSEYILREERYLAEEQSTLRLYEHAQTGARVLHMDNADDNKVFAIGFRTLPMGSTGNCHILEHSVLNGSRKYPVKEPFVHLIKRSLQTYLNAVTYPDKTVYPVASRNDADFRNLMDVYLDGVFHPNVLTDPRIFRQEGWRYEMAGEDDPITLAGVVYNEMRGAMSDTEEQVIDAADQLLYAGTPYAFNSGGDPEVIPTLTYEAFCDYYRTFYHPSNAYIFLYGKLDMEAVFGHLDEYLLEFDRKTVDSLPPLAPQWETPQVQEATYSVSADAETAHRTYYTFSVLMPETGDATEALLMQTLGDVLVDAESAPLRRRLLQELDCEDVFSNLSSVRQRRFMIVAKNAPAGQRDLFARILREELTHAVQDGLDADILRATLQTMEYRLKEKGNYATKGILHTFSALDFWLYDRDPIDGIAYRSALNALKGGAKTHLFEQFIDRNILHNAHRLLVAHVPEPGKNERKDAALADRLAAKRAAMSAEARAALLQATADLAAYQRAEDSPEALATLPRLSLKEVKQQTARIPREVVRRDGTTFLLHDLPTAGIRYLDIVFDIAHLSVMDLPMAALVCELVGLMNTDAHSYETYSNLEHTLTGGIHLTPTFYTAETGAVRRKAVLSTKLLSMESLPAALDLIEEQLLHTDFSDRTRLKALIGIVRSQFESSLLYNAHRIMANRALAGVSTEQQLNERVNGLDFYQFVREKSERWTDEDQAALERVAGALFHAPGVVVNLTAEAHDFPKMMADISALLARFPQAAPTAAPFTPSLFPRREAFSVSSDVQYVCAARPFLPEQYSGKLVVLSSLLSSDFLWNEIRARGGAYGAGVSLYRYGALVAYSYRDPHLRRTMQTYQGMAQYLRTLSLDQETLEQAIIGTVGNFDPPMTEQTKGRVDLALFLTGQTYENLDKRIAQALSTRPADLASLAEVFDLGDVTYLAVLGSPAKLQKNADLFDRIVPLD